MFSMSSLWNWKGPMARLSAVTRGASMASLTLAAARLRSTPVPWTQIWANMSASLPGRGRTAGALPTPLPLPPPRDSSAACARLHAFMMTFVKTLAAPDRNRAFWFCSSLVMFLMTPAA